MTTYLSENWDATSVGSLPSGWSNVFAGWSVQTAPAGLSGRVLQAANQASDNFCVKSHTRITTGVLYRSVTFKTPSSTGSGERALQVRDTDGGYSTPKHAILVYNGTVYGVDANTNLGFSALSTNTVYTLEWWVDLDADKVLAYRLGGVVKNNGGSGWTLTTAYGAVAGIDGIAFNNYAAVSQTYNVDDVLSDNTTAAPTSTPVSGSDTGTGTDTASSSVVQVSKSGTDTATGTDSSSLYARTPGPPAAGTITMVGPNLFGEDQFTYTADAGLDATTACTPQRRIAGSGGTWNDCTSVTTVTNNGGGSWSFRVRRTTYGTGGQPLGTTFEYRVVPANAVGTGTASAAVASSPTFTSPSTLIDRDMERLAAAFVASGVGYLDSTIANGRVYPGEVLLQMAWGFRRNTSKTNYRTHALNQLAYCQSLKDANGIIHFPEYATQTYLDHHGRTAYHIAAAARCFELAGDTSTAQTFWTEANNLAKAIFTKLNSGSPEVSHTYNGILRNSQPAWPANTVVTAGDIYRPTTTNGHSYRVMGTPGQTFNTGSTQPTWPTGVGSTVTVNGVTYRETSATGTTLYRDYGLTPNYGTFGDTGFDVNQQVEIAALLTLLCESDKSADFYPSGTIRTRALDVIAGTVALATTFQGYDFDKSSHGGVSIGYDDSFAGTYQEYDTLYGSFSLETLSVILKRSGAEQHPAHTLFIARGYNWLDTFHTEPITGARWQYGLVNTESWFAAACCHVAAVLSEQSTSRIEELLWQSCFWYPPAQESGNVNAFALEYSYQANGWTAAASPAYPNRSDFEPLAILDAANLAITSTITGSDSASGSDSSSPIIISLGKSASDTGTSSEGTATVSVGSVNLSTTDSGVGSETTSLSLSTTSSSKSATDTGVGADVGIAQVNITLSVVTTNDFGTGTEASAKFSIGAGATTRIVRDTYVTSAQFGTKTVSSDTFGDRTVYVHPESTIP